MTSSNKKKNILLLNRFKYHLYTEDEKFFIDEKRYNLSILHNKEKKFKFPSDKFSQAFICDLDNGGLKDNIIREIHNCNPFEKIVSVTEQDLILAAKLREMLNLEGMNINQAISFRDKIRMKKVLEENNIKVPKFKKVKDKKDIIDFLNKHEKIVVKPISGMGSAETFIINSIEEVNELLDRDIDILNYEVEEFIDGVMYHCDSVVKYGEVVFSVTNRYMNSTMDYNKSYYLGSIMIDDSILDNKINIFNQKVIQALQLQNGATHLEVFVKPNDEIIFCEIAARIGGGAIMPTIKAAYDINLLECDILAQLEEPIEIPNNKKKHAGFVMFYTSEGTIRHISDDSLLDDEWIETKIISNKVGDYRKAARNSGDAVAMFVITGETEQQIVQRINIVRERFNVEVE